MSNSRFSLNTITKSIAQIFPGLLIFAPIIATGGTISNNIIDVPQIFSTDTEYTITEGVTVSSNTNDPAVSITGPVTKKTVNQGTIIGDENSTSSALLIDSSVSRFSFENTGTITSKSANAIDVLSMTGNIDNAGTISGKEIGISLGQNVSTLTINNLNGATISGKTALSSNASISVYNNGTISGSEGNGIQLNNGSSVIDNAGKINSTSNGVLVSGASKVNIHNSGLIQGDEYAINFSSSQDNILYLETGSELIGDVISSASTGNAIELMGKGTEDSNFIGLNDGDGFKSLTMSGEDWTLSGKIDLIGTGDALQVNTGKLTLTGAVANSGTTAIKQNATLQLGDGEKTATLSGNLTNNGAFIFNQGSNFTFASNMTGSGRVEKIDGNTLTLTGNNGYTGDTQLRSGTTLVADGATLGVEGSGSTVTIDDGATFASEGRVYNNVAILSGGTLAAWNAVAGNLTSSASGVDTINGNVSNRGTLLIGGQNSPVGNNFTINGDYFGEDGSKIVMNSKPGDDNAPTDRLTITGNSNGKSGVSINNIGGLGAQTVNGMRVVSVGGNSDAELTLSKPVVAGKWEYSLNKHNDGNWYLESKPTPSNDDNGGGDNGNGGGDSSNGGGDNGNGDGGSDNGGGGNGGNGGGDNGNGDGGSGNGGGGNGGGGNGNVNPPEIVAPEVGAYLGNYQAAQGMFLHKRDDRDQLTLRNEDNLNTWMYVKGRYLENGADGDKISYNTNTTVLQVGTDFLSEPLKKGILHAGGMFGAGQAKTHSDSRHNVRNAQGKVDGFNVGLYATWQEDQKLRQGGYVDSWASYSWFNNKVTSNRNDEDYSSKGFAASLEAGYAWVVPSENDRTWKIEPQAQAIYSYLDQNTHTDRDGVRVSQMDKNSVLGRLGVKTSYVDQKDVQAWQPYVGVNWLKGAGQNDLAFNGEKSSNNTPDDRGQLELGITGNLNTATTLSLRATGEWGENSYNAWGGHILLNHRW